MSKLVRDKIPEIIEQDGRGCHYRILDQEEYCQKLKEKLVEEANEVLSAKNKQELQEELADVMEVYQALINVYHFDERDLKEIQYKKVIKNGGFSKRILLESYEEKK